MLLIACASAIQLEAIPSFNPMPAVWSHTDPLDPTRLSHTTEVGRELGRQKMSLEYHNDATEWNDAVKAAPSYNGKDKKP